MSIGTYAVATDTGRKRRRNEDAYVVAPPLFAVADGMGGAQAGEVASKLAAAALEETDPGVDVDSFTIDAHEGDVFLLCSDGLTDMVGDDDILEVAAKYRDDLDRVTKSLVSAANRGGGEDNITVVAFTISADGETARMP